MRAINKCIDYNKQINKKSVRCRLCSNKRRVGEKNPMYNKPAWNKGLNKTTDERIRGYGLLIRSSKKGKKIKELDKIKAKKYGLRQEEWIRLSKKIRGVIGHCKICGFNKDIKKLDVHHIIPYEKSKSNKKENLIVVCHRCHSKIHYHLFKGNLWKINNG